MSRLEKILGLFEQVVQTKQDHFNYHAEYKSAPHGSPTIGSSMWMSYEKMKRAHDRYIAEYEAFKMQLNETEKRDFKLLFDQKRDDVMALKGMDDADYKFWLSNFQQSLMYPATLESYIAVRRLDERENFGFFSRFILNKTVKLSAATKLQKLLNSPNDFQDQFTPKEIQALQQGRLGRIVKTLAIDMANHNERYKANVV